MGEQQTWHRPDDFADLPSGPWSDEPDKVQWEDEATGLPCLIVRNRLGALCGYVGVEPGHALHGVSPEDCTLPEPCGERWCDHCPSALLSAHGQVNYGAGCEEGDDPAAGVCHVPQPGRSDDVWWFGFDCAHAFDLVPLVLDAMYPLGVFPSVIEGCTYRTVGYVQGECLLLAGQLALMSDGC